MVLICIDYALAEIMSLARHPYVSVVLICISPTIVQTVSPRPGATDSHASVRHYPRHVFEELKATFN